jgi:flagellar biosynthesis chaperone FliJ
VPGQTVASPKPVLARPGQDIPRRLNGAVPDLDVALQAMRKADSDLGQARHDLEKAQRQLRTSEYTLSAYRRNPQDRIDPGTLAVMTKDAEAKGNTVRALQLKVDDSARIAEERRRDVRASLMSDG